MLTTSHFFLIIFVPTVLTTSLKVVVKNPLNISGTIATGFMNFTVAVNFSISDNFASTGTCYWSRKWIFLKPPPLKGKVRIFHTSLFNHHRACRGVIIHRTTETHCRKILKGGLSVIYAELVEIFPQRNEILSSYSVVCDDDMRNKLTTDVLTMRFSSK